MGCSKKIDLQPQFELMQNCRTPLELKGESMRKKRSILPEEIKENDN